MPQGLVNNNQGHHPGNRSNSRQMQGYAGINAVRQQHEVRTNNIHTKSHDTTSYTI